MTYGAIDLASDLAASTDVEGVESVVITITEASFNIVGLPVQNNIHPQNIVDAQFPMYYQVPTAWCYGSRAGWTTYEKLKDVKVKELSGRNTVLADDTLDELETKLTVEWKDGTCQSVRLHRPLGEDSNPFTEGRIEQKFFGLTRTVYGNGTALRIRDIVDVFEDHSIAELLDLVK